MQSSLDYNGYLQFLIGLQTAKLAGKKEINLLLQCRKLPEHTFQVELVTVLR